jgi:hypothetical protein
MKEMLTRIKLMSDSDAFILHPSSFILSPGVSK